MQYAEFIKEISNYIIRYADKYEIKVYSPIIAQAILESSGGTSDLAVNANNYFNLKFIRRRCKTATNVYYTTDDDTKWCMFDNMQDAVIGYFDFINISKYSKLKNINDPNTYISILEKLKFSDDKNYADELMKIIKKYNLTKFDNKEEKKYRCITGIYRVEDVAKQEAKFLKNHKINATVEEHNKKYYVQVGVYKKKENAAKRAEDIINNKHLEVHTKYF